MDRLAKMLALDIPQGHVDRAHSGDANRRAAKVHRAAVHLLPEAVRLQRVFPDDDLSQPTGNVMAEGRIDNRFDDFRRGVRFADSFQPCIGPNANQYRILATGGFRLDVFDPQNLTLSHATERYEIVLSWA